MSLAGPTITDEQNWFGPLYVAAFGEVPHLRCGDQRCLRVVEFFECFHAWQMCLFDPTFDRIPLPFFDLGC